MPREELTADQVAGSDEVLREDAPCLLQRASLAHSIVAVRAQRIEAALSLVSFAVEHLPSGFQGCRRATVSTESRSEPARYGVKLPPAGLAHVKLLRLRAKRVALTQAIRGACRLFVCTSLLRAGFDFRSGESRAYGDGRVEGVVRAS